MQHLVRRKGMAGFAQLVCRRNQRHPCHTICGVDGVARRAPHRHRRVHVLAMLQRAMTFQACSWRCVRLQRYRMLHDCRAGPRRALCGGPTLRHAAQSKREYNQHQNSATENHSPIHSGPVRSFWCDKSNPFADTAILAHQLPPHNAARLRCKSKSRDRGRGFCTKTLTTIFPACGAVAPPVPSLPTQTASGCPVPEPCYRSSRSSRHPASCPIRRRTGPCSAAPVRPGNRR